MRIRNRAPKDPYKHTTYGGKEFNWRTRAMLMVLGKRLYNDPYILTVYQGSYNRGVSASAGTHDGGGAVDLSSNDGHKKVCEGRLIGFAIWLRKAIQGVWDEHLHGIAIGDEDLAPLARAQVEDYRDQKNGLSDHSHDSTDCHPNDRRFNYQAWRKSYNNFGRWWDLRFSTPGKG